MWLVQAGLFSKPQTYCDGLHALTAARVLGSSPSGTGEEAPQQHANQSQYCSSFGSLTFLIQYRHRCQFVASVSLRPCIHYVSTLSFLRGSWISRALGLSDNLKSLCVWRQPLEVIGQRSHPPSHSQASHSSSSMHTQTPDSIPRSIERPVRALFEFWEGLGCPYRAVAEGNVCLPRSRLHLVHP